MKVELSDKDLEIIECMAYEWDNGDMCLYGKLSYQMVHDLLTKLHIDIPSKLTTICSDDFEATDESMIKLFSKK